MSDAALLERARSGTGPQREEACRQLYQSLQGRVFQLCLRLCGERALAEDAMQNTFFAAFRGLDAFRGEALFSTWLYRVAIREALALRSRRPREEPPQAAAQVPSAAAPLDEQAAARQRAQRTQAAFRLLSADHQAVLTLFAVEGLRHRQVAEVLGVEEKTAWSRLHEARQALRARLGED